MKTKRLIWQLWPSYLVIVGLSILAVALYSGRALRRNHYDLTEQKLLAVARIIATDIAEDPTQLASSSLNDRCRVLAEQTGLRVTLVLRTGKVVADTEEDPERMDDHSDRPEIRDALLQPYGQSVRRSDTVRRDMMYVAVPIVVDGKRLAVARVSHSLDGIDGAVQAMFGQLAIAGLCFAALAGGFSIFMARRLSWPLQQIRQWAGDFAEGHHGGRLPVSPITEINVLASTMNSMACQLNQRIDEIKRQRDEQDALLSCMGEGVLAVDNDQHLIKLNAAAARLFSIDREHSLGKHVIHVIRNADLHALVERTLGGGAEPVEGLLHLHARDKYFQVHGTTLKGGHGKQIGALLVLNDVTQLRKLETMRRDFVANVSHELKTPITAIKGFSETLLSEAGENAEERAHFLAIIHRQSQRLQTIVEDLLTLSSIEHADESDMVDLQECRLLPVLQSAVRTCAVDAELRKMLVTVDCPEDLKARLNMAFMEQAVINLIDNAVKYSEPGTTVQVRGAQGPESITISVEDQGPGISSQHLSRIFERFYRVDKSRSRKQGGTGLGLAIVKRIAIFHGGHVEAESRIGEGCTFTITLPV